MVDCEFEVITRKKCDSYRRRRRVTAVVDCSVDQSAVMDGGFEVLSGKSVIVIHVDGR